MKKRAKNSKLQTRNKPGRTKSRKFLLSDTDPIRKRVAYLCEYFFAGDVNAFAFALDLDVVSVRKVLYKTRTVSVRFAAQVIRQLRVRPEWLLNGTGPISADQRSTHDTPEFHLPTAFASSFVLFDPTTASHGLAPDMKKPTSSAVAAELPTPQSPHFSLAIAIHTARSNNAPVMVCLSDAAMHAGAGNSVCSMLRKKYVTSVALTGAGAVADIFQSRPTAKPDMNLIAKLAAAQGLGYGEAIARWGFSPESRLEKSVIHTAYSEAAPVTAHAEVGELSDHLYAAARGAELGAVVGAASYVDLLVFTEQVRRVLAAGGVVIVVGSAERFFRLFAQAMCAAETTLRETANFCVGVIDRFFPEEEFAVVEKYGGTGCLLQGSFNSNTLNILHACDAVYSGNIPNEFKK